MRSLITTAKGSLAACAGELTPPTGEWMSAIARSAKVDRPANSSDNHRRQFCLVGQDDFEIPPSFASFADGSRFARRTAMAKRFVYVLRSNVRSRLNAT